MHTYLKTPTGQDWAWQSKAKLLSVVRSIPMYLLSVENVGGREPIGSKKSLFVIWMIIFWEEFLIYNLNVWETFMRPYIFF